MKVIYEIELNLPGDFRVQVLENLFRFIKSSIRDRFDKGQVRFRCRRGHATQKHG